jgi:hypothetical protein
VPEREKADLLHAGNLLIFRLVCDLKGGSWREAAVRAWDELATEDLGRPVDATHLQHDQLKLLKLSN